MLVWVYISLKNISTGCCWSSIRLPYYIICNMKWQHCTWIIDCTGVFEAINCLFVHMYIKIHTHRAQPNIHKRPTTRKTIKTLITSFLMLLCVPSLAIYNMVNEIIRNKFSLSFVQSIFVADLFYYNFSVFLHIWRVFFFSSRSR